MGKVLCRHCKRYHFKKY